VPEGDTLHRAAARLQPLVGETLEVVAVHPRAQAADVAPTLDGRRLESVEAVGKNLVFCFERGVVLRSHLRMTGKWSVRPSGTVPTGTPWLILRGSMVEGVLWGGPVLELHTRALVRLGPDILARPPDIDGMLARMSRADPTRTFGETLLDQTLVAGIGNIWCSESLWEARLSPWISLGDVSEDDRRAALETAARLMRGAVDGPEMPRRNVYKRAGRPCPRCGTPVRAHGIGDANRTAYWCPACQDLQAGKAPK
jgi:endonuclease VIII